MATIDSLDIQISGSVQKANVAINDLIKNLGRLANSLKIDTSRLEKIGKTFNFSGVDKAAKNMQSQTQKVSKSLSQIMEQYKDLGKGFEIKGSTQQMQKQIDSLTNKLANAKLAKEDFEASGKTNLGGYETSVKNVIKYTNQIESLKNQLAGLQLMPENFESFKQKNPNFRIIRDEAGQKFIVEYKKELLGLQKTIDQIGKGYGGIENAPKGTFDIQIGNLKQSIEELKQSFPQATNVISAFEKELHRLQEVSSKLTKEPIRPKIETGRVDEKVKETIQKTDSLGNRVETLKAKLKELSGQGLNFGDAKFDETYKKLNQASEELKKHKNNLDQAGNSGKSFSERMKNALANVNSQTNKTSGSMGKLASSIKKALHSVKQSSDGFGGFAKKVGLLYAKIYVLRRGFNALFGTVKSSMDYIETLNYFNAAFEQIAKKEDLKSFKEMGYDSAEAYYNSFSERAEKLTRKMSGFKIEESGMAVSTGGKSLGIDPSLLMQNQATFAQMSSSMGIASETAANLSSVFTRLGADIASLKNEDFQKVWQNMASGMTGMSRAVDKYGMNIREANLQQTLANIGIDKSISKLTQQEKVLLRTIVMLDSSRVAWGDLAKTMNQPANQLRLLQSNWSNLSRTIGNIFLPIVAKALPYINAFTIMLQRFAERIVKFLGFKDFDWGGLGETGGADIDLDFGDAEDDSAGIADNMDKTAKKAKKAVDNLQGFDIINKLQDPNKGKDSDGAGEGNGGKGLSGGDMSKLSGALDKLLSEYDKAWNKAFKGMENKANELANKMQKALTDAWNKGDFSELGKKVAAWINKGLAKIPWDKIESNVKKIAKSIATFLNGFIAELDWTLVGKTIAEGLNTAVEGAYEFWTTFDWLKFGTSLSTGVNSFIDNFDAEKFGKLLGAKLRGVIQLAFGFVTNLNFEELGKKIGNAINGFFEDMGEVRQNTGLTGWQELGQTISKSITGILDTINTALSTVKWTEVGKAIGQFLGSIDWFGIIGKTGKAIANAIFSAIKVGISAFMEDPIGVSKAIVSVLGALFAYNKIKGIAGIFSGSMGSVILDGIKNTSVVKAATNLATNLKTSISTAIKTSSIGQAISGSLGPIAAAAVAAAISGALIADRLKEAIDAINFTGEYEMKVPEAMKKSSEEAQKSFENTAKSVEDTKNKINELNKTVETTNGEKVKDLADKYYKLSQKTNPTASDIAVLKQYSEELSQQIPGLSVNIDKQTGAFKGSKEKLDGMVSSLERAAKAQAAYNISVELYEKQQKNKKTIEEKEKVLKKYEEEYESVKKITEQVKKRSGANSAEYENQVRILGTYANKVNATRSEIDALKGSQKDIAEQIKKNNTIMENAKVSTKNYAEANKTLKEKMNNLGVSSKEQKKIIEDLNTAVNNGEIKWKDYKKIVEGNYTSVDELKGAIEKLTPKEVKVSASVEGKGGVENLKTAIHDLPSEKTLAVGFKLKGNLKQIIQNAINSLEIAPITVKLRAPSGKSLEEVARTTSEGLKKAFGKTGGTPTNMKASNIDAKNKTAKVDKNNFMEIQMWKLSGYKVMTYKTGGFPEDGWFRANHGEIMGRFDNGKSVVANNMQITEGIANAVYPAVYSAMKAANAEIKKGGREVLVLDKSYQEITKGIIDEANRIAVSRGRSPFWGVT